MNSVMEMMKSGNTSIPNFWFAKYRSMGISDSEFLFIISVINKGVKFKNDSKEIAKFLNIKSKELLEIISSLEEKKLIVNDLEKDETGKFIEYIDLHPFYEKMSMSVMEKGSKEKNSDIYSIFENEFGRPLSPIEFEIITKWLEDDMNEEVIMEALKEAVYNGVRSLRYIDKIIYEWAKKGIKSADDLNNNYRKKKEEDIEKTQVFDYNWLDDNDE